MEQNLPNTSELNTTKKEKEVFIVQIVEKNYLTQILNMKVDLVGHRFINLYQMYLKLKLRLSHLEVYFLFLMLLLHHNHQYVGHQKKFVE